MNADLLFAAGTKMLRGENCFAQLCQLSVALYQPRVTNKMQHQLFFTQLWVSLLESLFNDNESWLERSAYRLWSNLDRTLFLVLIFFLSSLFSTRKENPRRGCRRVLTFCMGSQKYKNSYQNKILLKILEGG